MSILELEDLSDEIILKVLGFLDVKNLLRVGHVSNRLRSDFSIDFTVLLSQNCESWDNNHSFLSIGQTEQSPKMTIFSLRAIFIEISCN